MEKALSFAAFFIVLLACASAKLTINFQPTQYEGKQQTVNFRIEFSWSPEDKIAGFIVPIPPCLRTQTVDECTQDYYTNVVVTSNPPNWNTSESGCMYYTGSNDILRGKISCTTFDNTTSLVLAFKADNIAKDSGVTKLRKIERWNIGVANASGIPDQDIYVTILWPEVKITEPKENSTVSGTVKISAQITNNIVPDTVLFNVIGNGTTYLLGEDSDLSDGISINWNTDGFSAGEYTLMVTPCYSQSICTYPDRIKVMLAEPSPTPAESETPTPSPTQTPTPALTPSPTPTPEPTGTPTTKNLAPVITSLKVYPKTVAEEHEPFTFTVSAYDPEGKPLTILWNFGDGSTAKGSRVEHSYTVKSDLEEQSFIVTVTVKDERGASDSKQVVVHVKRMKFNLNIIEPQGLVKKGSVITLKLGIETVNGEKIELRNIQEPKVKIKGKEIALKKDSKTGLLVGTLNTDYTFNPVEEATFTAKILVRYLWKPIQKTFYLKFSPARINATNPFTGSTLYPSYYIDEVTTKLSLPDGSPVTAGEFFAEIREGGSKKVKMRYENGLFYANLGYTVTEEDLENGLSISFTGEDEYGNFLDEEFGIALSQENKLLDIESEPSLDELSQLNYGQPIKINTKIISPKIDELQDIKIKMILEDLNKIIEFVKKENNSYEAEVVMPETESKLEKLNITFIVEAKLDGNTLSIMKRQKAVLSKELNVKILSPKEIDKPLEKIDAKITYTNGEPFIQDEVDAKLIVDGVAQNIKLRRGEDDLYSAALSEPITPAEHSIELRVEDGLSGSAYAKIRPKKPYALVLLAALALILLIGGLILGYILHTVKTRAGMPIASQITPEIKKMKKKISTLTELLIPETITKGKKLEKKVEQEKPAAKAKGGERKGLQAFIIPKKEK
jgi:hypothetical protein